MPFKSKAQARAAFGGHIPGFSKEKAEEWSHKTKNMKKLPEHVSDKESKKHAEQSVLSEHNDPPGYMMVQNLNQLADQAAQLSDAVSVEDNAEPWVESKIDRAAQSIDAVHDYMKYKEQRSNSEIPESLKLANFLHNFSFYKSANRFAPRRILSLADTAAMREAEREAAAAATAVAKREAKREAAAAAATAVAKKAIKPTRVAREAKREAAAAAARRSRSSRAGSAGTAAPEQQGRDLTPYAVGAGLVGVPAGLYVGNQMLSEKNAHAAGVYTALAELGLNS